jgi:hypothetical protein
MIVAIHQPQFMPWLGFFDKMDRADAFVVLDNVQFKKNEWQNRNRIRTAQGTMWLTVPVSFSFPDRIGEVLVSNQTNWRHKHLQALRTNYSRAAAWEHLAAALEGLYASDYTALTAVNQVSMDWLCSQLDVSTQRLLASDLPDLSEQPTQRLVDICQHLGADTYLAGAGGRGYMDMDCFERAGIHVIFQEYGHPVYTQLFGEFVSHLSALDLVLNCGDRSPAILRSGRACH